MEERYNLRNVTPEANRCMLGCCPAIYLRDITPKANQCGSVMCPSIHSGESTYVIVGKKVDISKAGLEGKVGKDETAIEVPKEIIDNKMK